jgi:hypothetical protein
VGNKYKTKEENNKNNNYNIDINSTTKIIYKINLFKIFALNKRPDIADIKKLQYIYNTLRQNTFHNQIGGSIWTGSAEI